MTDPQTCPQCHAPLPAGAAEGLCPACLLRRGLEPNTVPNATESSPRWMPPAPADLSASFPELDLLELIGRGGMGAVYKARQKQLSRIVALKILPPEIGRDPAFAERFAREAQALARLNHPHIVMIHDFGQRGELFFFVMEYVDGLNLRQLLDAGNISPKEALAIVPQICEALQYAHDHAIVHRDIKPENILLSRGGDVKIADFGLAKLMGRSPVDGIQPERVMGTPQYMAPEQSERPAEVDHRADIYALGVVFYQMLTGELPTGAFAPPSHKVQIDVRLDEVVLRAMEKLPQRRYQQASQVKTAVETIVATPAASHPHERHLLHLDGILKFQSCLALNVARVGFLGCLGFLGFLGSLQGWEQFSRLFGLFGLFGFSGVAYIIEVFARSKGKAIRRNPALLSLLGILTAVLVAIAVIVTHDFILRGRSAPAPLTAAPSATTRPSLPIAVIAARAYVGDIAENFDLAGSIGPAAATTQPATGEQNAVTVTFDVPEPTAMTLIKEFPSHKPFPVLVFAARDSGNSPAAQGLITHIDNELDADTQTLKCVAEVSPTPGVVFLRNQFVTVRVVLKQKHWVTLLPASAINTDKDSHYVNLILPNHTVLHRAVTTGFQEADQVEIIHGISPGDLVVVDAATALSNGAAVSYSLNQPTSLPSSVTMLEYLKDQREQRLQDEKPPIVIKAARARVREVEHGFSTPGSIGPEVPATQPTTGAPPSLTVIFDVSPSWAIPILKGSAVHKNFPVTVFDIVGQEVAEGAITNIGKEFDSETHALKCTATITPNPGAAELLRNQSVKVDVILDRHQATVVPQAAIQADSRSSWHVYVIQADQTIAQRQVTPGLDAPAPRGVPEAEIKSGISPGDLVVAEAYNTALSAIIRNGGLEGATVTYQLDQPLLSAQQFNSKLDMLVESQSDVGAELQLVGRTPATRPLEVPACMMWWVKPMGNTSVEAVVGEVQAQSIPGLILEQATDADLMRLKDLRELQGLYLDLGPQVTDAGLDSLKDLQSLLSLDLDDAKVTDAGVAKLKRMKGLRELSLNNTQVTDAGLENLKDLKDLQFVCLCGTRVTDAGVAKLREALPNCKIVSEPSTRSTSRPLAADASFGPVIERVVNNSGSDCLIDLNTGNFITVPADINERGSRAALDWYAAHGVDAGGFVTDLWYGLYGFDMIAIRGANRNWDDNNIQSMRDAIALGKPGNPLEMSVGDSLPATFIFETREGSIGRLQIVGFTDNPLGVKIRYKLLQNPTTRPTRAPATTRSVSRLQFRIVRPRQDMTSPVDPFPDPNNPGLKLAVLKDVLMDESSLASVSLQPAANPTIDITFTDAGKHAFDILTRDHINQQLAVILDGKVLCVPNINTEISGGNAVLSFPPHTGPAEARKIADTLKCLIDHQE